MRIADEPAFVLHARPWRESSLLVEMLSANHGRIGVVARGVSGPKKQVLKAALQPLQFLRVDLDYRGEMARLIQAEAVDIAPRLQGDALLSGFYLNELTMRLVPRNDAHGDLFLAYAQTRLRIADPAENLSWTLRRFERDLLDAVGVGFSWHLDRDGAELDPAARYVVDAEQGPMKVLSERDMTERAFTPTGRALLALAGDQLPESADLASLRVPMRVLLQHHLGARGLKSWDMQRILRGQTQSAAAKDGTKSAS